MFSPNFHRWQRTENEKDGQKWWWTATQELDPYCTTEVYEGAMHMQMDWMGHGTGWYGGVESWLVSWHAIRL